MEKIKQIFAQSFWQVLGKAFSSISTLLVLGVISRSYGESGTGVYSLTITYLSFFFLAADLGLNAYFLPRLSESRNVANNLF
ncbi:hypothetical protein HYS97_00680, partial [Candidatus Daviesbacteria bacterium]|nr:hypothetical protein [Candidatus Daviesbacteria bacterium]